jgi:ABC-type oligopeptide transport system substrate-binding subunit
MSLKGGLLMFLSRYAILMFILALLLLSLSSCASNNSTKLLSEKDISVSSDYTQKGREFTVFATLSPHRKIK